MVELALLGEQLRQCVARCAGGLAAALCAGEVVELEQLRKDLRAARECLREYRLLCEEWQALEQLRLPFGGGVDGDDPS